MATNPLVAAKQSIIDFVASRFPDATVALADVVAPPNSEMGDLAFGCFALAKAARLAPPKIAADLAEAFVASGSVGRAVAAGPYVNFFLDREAIVADVAAQPEPVIAPGPDAGTKAMVEYVSPNNNKPLHLGHVRNGVLGVAVSNLLEARGAKVIRALLLNDRGMAIAKSMVAYKEWGIENGIYRTPDSTGIKGDHFVADYYVMFESRSSETFIFNPNERAPQESPEQRRERLEGMAHEVIQKWEAGDRDTIKLWREMSDWCEAGQHVTYARLGFQFDVEYKESEIYKGGKEIVELGLKTGIFTKDETGAVVAKFSETDGLPDKVVLRADGTSLYITQDLFLAKKKIEEQGLDASLYVVGNEQNLHFKQLFKILELLGYPWASKLRHLSYGYVTLPEGRMKSREGTVVDADDLLTSLEDEAAEEIRNRYPDLAGDVLAVRAHDVALAAIKFHFLEVDIASDTVFDPKASLSFNGRTGPYIQYMHARIASIVRKAASDFSEPSRTQGDEVSRRSGNHGAIRDSEESAGVGVAPGEFHLAMAVAEYPDAVARAADQLRPSLVAAQLYAIAKSVATFYEDVPVLSAGAVDRTRRTDLLIAAGGSLRHGLGLLGIAAPNEM
jgi:arginyl-tRNA synthetase